MHHLHRLAKKKKKKKNKQKNPWLKLVYGNSLIYQQVVNERL